MLQTLAKIGEQLLEGKSIWARLTTEPNIPKPKKDQDLWVCPILFDCEDNEIKILEDEMELFKKNESALKFRFVKATRKGPSQSKFDLTVEFDDLANLQESLFGKKAKAPGCLSTLQNELPEVKNSDFEKRLILINNKLSGKAGFLSETNVKDILGDTFKDIILFTAYFRDAKTKIVPLFEQDEFRQLVTKVFTRENPANGLSFISGNKIPDAVQAQFWSRYNIHKIFQTSAYNYAAGLNKKNHYQNFQGNDDDFDRLDRASRYVLENLQTRIAGITHIVIPNFLSKDLDEFDLETTELYLDKTSDLLFRYQSLEAEIEKELPEVKLFWVNYIAFESDGNSFKIINHINDVNSNYLSKLTETFNHTGIDFENYIGGKYLFNLQSVFDIIPVRDTNKSKVNPALNLFKDILEQKFICTENLFRHFIELTLCYWYGRYAAFKNIIKIDSFDFAIKDAVFKYSALIYTLRKLNLLEMENEPSPQSETPESIKSDFQQRIEAFFQKMEYSESEKALFYLGRILSSVAYAQYKKGHESKPVLNKINYNGMDADSIVRLTLDLREKVRQYNIHRETDWDFGRFTGQFNEKDWPLSKEQNVFYLMAGYSFGLTKSDNNS